MHVFAFIGAAKVATMAGVAVFASHPSLAETRTSFLDKAQKILKERAHPKSNRDRLLDFVAKDDIVKLRENVDKGWSFKEVEMLLHILQRITPEVAQNSFDAAVTTTKESVEVATEAAKKTFASAMDAVKTVGGQVISDFKTTFGKKDDKTPKAA